MHTIVLYWVDSEKANKEDALKKVVKVEAERDAAVNTYVPHTDATHITTYTLYIHSGMRFPCI
jgi:ribosomal protein S12